MHFKKGELLKNGIFYRWKAFKKMQAFNPRCLVKFKTPGMLWHKTVIVSNLNTAREISAAMLCLRVRGHMATFQGVSGTRLPPHPAGTSLQ